MKVSQSEPKCLLSVDAGGTYFKYAPRTPDGALLAPVQQVPAHSDGTAEEIFSAYRTIIETVGKDYDITAILISTPGPFDYAAGCSRMVHKFPAIRDIPLRSVLCSFVGKEVPVRFLSDSAAFLAGARNCSDGNCAGITVGTGLGFALSRGAEILLTSEGRPLRHLYNLPCRGGILEDYVSGRGIVRLYEELGGTTDENAKTIGQFAESDPSSLGYLAYRTAGDLLGSALVPFVTEYALDTVILGGQVSRTFAPLYEGIMLHLNGTGVTVRPAENIADAPLFGTLYALKGEQL